MKQYTTTSCFSTFMLPYILFVRDFEERKKTVMTCCLGWNISLFPDIAQREQQIDMVWKMVEADNQELPPPGLEQGFKQDLRMLVTQKRDLFPWLMKNIPKAELNRNETWDVLSIDAGKGVEEIQLVTHPDPMGLPYIIEVLRGIHRDTEAQADLIQQARRTPGAIKDMVTTEIVTAYCVQRADLIGYRRMLTVWLDVQPAPSVKRVIGHWLGVLNEIEMHTKTLLGILTEIVSIEES
ncbi:hypothetical protein ACH50O_23180 (plasmid) [Methylomonas sp. 2BW1-5-20]|uniref:hypothetical protein n=1 Tax=Methylomonas sp. 2BW1-5-20 TaxID=3376686 RepID=UPI004051A86D